MVHALVPIEPCLGSQRKRPVVYVLDAAEGLRQFARLILRKVEAVRVCLAWYISHTTSEVSESVYPHAENQGLAPRLFDHPQGPSATP